ncbi:MAG TPA: hypothetical protein VE990_05435 [Acidimicrobiales bacterium]|nr:hypothetical protein [Acidimicrobiales bacterium]
MAFVVLGLILVALGGLWLVTADLIPGADDSDWSRPRRSRSAASRGIQGEVVLATPLRRGAIALDCLVQADPNDPTRPLEPVHLLARGPMLFWGGSSLEEIVAGWVEAGAQVLLEVSDDPARGTRACLTQGPCMVVLDVIERGDLDRRVGPLRRAHL